MSDMTLPVQNYPAQDNLFFKTIIDGYISNPRFIHREWLASDVQQAMQQKDNRFVLLTAEPGAGKSTFMAQLAHDHPDWLVYFIRRDQRTPLGDVGAKSFLLRIGFQLAARFPDLFTPDQAKISITQRVGTSKEASEVVGAEIKRLLASPFYQKVIQIHQEVQQHGGQLVGLQIEELVIEARLLDLEDLQYMALIDPALALFRQYPDLRIVLLVDALDEIRYHQAEQDILSWLTGCPELPDNIRFVLTSRPPDSALYTFCEKQKPYLQRITIKTEDGRVREDLSTYAWKLVEHDELANVLAKTDRDVAGFLEQAVTKADGNLGYLDALGRAIDQALQLQDELACSALQTLLELQELPSDLPELYAFFLNQIKNEVTNVLQQGVSVKVASNQQSLYLPIWPSVYVPILGVLAVAFEPLTLQQIKKLGGIDTDGNYLTEAIDRLLQFLDRVDGRIRLYHSTVAEFLTNDQTHTTSTDLYIDPVDWHGRISDILWQKCHLDWSPCDDYDLKYLPSHLKAAVRESNLTRIYLKQLMELLTQDAFLRAKSERIGMYSVQSDFHAINQLVLGRFERRQLTLAQIRLENFNSMRLGVIPDQNHPTVQSILVECLALPEGDTQKRRPRVTIKGSNLIIHQRAIVRCPHSAAFDLLALWMQQQGWTILESLSPHLIKASKQPRRVTHSSLLHIELISMTQKQAGMTMITYCTSQSYSRWGAMKVRFNYFINTFAYLAGSFDMDNTEMRIDSPIQMFIYGEEKNSLLNLINYIEAETIADINPDRAEALRKRYDGWSRLFNYVFLSGLFLCGLPLITDQIWYFPTLIIVLLMATVACGFVTWQGWMKQRCAGQELPGVFELRGHSFGFLFVALLMTAVYWLF
jgi:hypothetical protein